MLSPEERTERRAKWEQQCVLYYNEVKKYIFRFNKKLREYILDGSMHDAFVQSITFKRCMKRGKTSFNIEIVFLTSFDKPVKFTYVDVQRFKTDLSLEDYINFGDYLYDEFLYENKLFTHNFVMFFDSETNITCKKIIVE